MCYFHYGEDWYGGSGWSLWARLVYRSSIHNCQQMQMEPVQVEKLKTEKAQRCWDQTSLEWEII